MTLVVKLSSKRMWFNKPRDKGVKRDQLRDKFEVSKIFNDYENIDRNIFLTQKI